MVMVKVRVMVRINVSIRVIARVWISIESADQNCENRKVT